MMLNKALLPLVLIMLSACSLTKYPTKNYSQTKKGNGSFLITAISTDPNYGYSPEKAVEVGGVKNSQGPNNERRYLNSLRGPNGETLKFHRRGSCCAVKSENGFGGYAMLDIYEVYWKGSDDTLSIYINMYDSTELFAPQGLTIR